jgi:uncharacterized alpha-E superfamily protein
MLSRAADSLYWMSRYLERAEHSARVINMQFKLMLERGKGADDRYWLRMLRSLGIDLAKETDELPPVAGQSHAQTLAQSLVRDTQHRASIVSCVMGARENARQVREQISSEMWEQLNRLFHFARDSSETDPWDASEFLQSVKDGAHLFQGITDSTMTHAEGWQFIQAGRFLERTQALSALIGEYFRWLGSTPEEGDSEHLEWIGLLRSCTAFEAYCKAYTAELKPERIAEFLLLNPSFPHSIRFSAAALDRAVKEIGGEVTSRRASRVERIAGRLHATLSFGQVDEIMSSGLDAYLETILRQCAQVHSALYQTYIAYPIEVALEA